MFPVRRLFLFGRTAEYTQMTVFIPDSKIAADGFVIGNGDVQAVMLIIDFLNEVIEHCGRKQQWYRKI